MTNKHIVCDSHVRSILMVATANVTEFVADWIIFTYWKFTGLEIAIIAQIVCISTTFLALRLWNRISWGRRVEDEKNAPDQVK